MFDWYRIFNVNEFEALGLISKTYTLELEGLGFKDILVTKSNFLSLTYEGVFLSVGLNDRNPFSMDGFAVYKNDNDDIFLGIAVDES